SIVSYCKSALKATDIINLFLNLVLPISEKDVTLFEKAHLAALAQRWWSDNSVSVTLSFDQETEGQHVGTVLSMYEGQLKTASFLPQGNATYPQMPYEEISEAGYQDTRDHRLKADLTPVYAGNAVDAVGEAFCTTDACEVTELKNAS